METVEILSLAEERAANGAAMLDAEWPGWAGRVAPGRLNMWDVMECILAQVFGTFAKGYLALNLNFDLGILKGFCLDDRVAPDELRDAWVAEVKKRLTGASPAPTEMDAPA